MHDDVCFEDWYIHPNHISKAVFQKFSGEKVIMNPGKINAKYIELFKQSGM